MDAAPGDLHPDAKDQEGAEAVDYLFATGAQAVDEARGIDITNIDQHADKDDGDKEGSKVDKMYEDVLFFLVRAEGEDDGDGAGAGAHGKGEGIEEEVVDISRPAIGLGRLIFPFDLVVRGEQLPAHAADHDTSGELDHRDGNAEQPEDIAADERGNGADDQAIERNLFCRAFPGRECQITQEGVYDKGRADGVDGGEQGKEADKNEIQEIWVQSHRQYYINLRVSHDPPEFPAHKINHGRTFRRSRRRRLDRRSDISRLQEKG
jgi:hypothetical protein